MKLMGIIRMLLTLSVLISHSNPLFGLKLVDGNIAVQLFFIISGFYMAMILTEKYVLEKDKLFWLNFYKSRFLRLYPIFVIVSVLTWVYFGCLTMYFGKIPANGFTEIFNRMPWYAQILSILSNITMFGQDIPSLFHVSADGIMHPFYSQNAGTAEDGALWVGQIRTIGQAWSIGTEIWFYLLAPILIRKSILSLITLSVISLGIKIFMESHHLLTYFFFPAQLCFFLIGVLGYKIYQPRIQKMSNELSKREKLTFATNKNMGFIGFSLFIFSLIIYPFTNSFYFQIFQYILLGCFIHPIFSMTANLKIDRLIGELSYPIYMIHMIIIQFFSNAFHKFLGMISVPSWIILMVSTLLSLVIYYYVDRPLNRYRQKFAS
jgi:peptidoglycan/LPS O-acetylase OafA/YrhL